MPLPDGSSAHLPTVVIRACCGLETDGPGAGFGGGGGPGASVLSRRLRSPFFLKALLHELGHALHHVCSWQRSTGVWEQVAEERPQQAQQAQRVQQPWQVQAWAGPGGGSVGQGTGAIAAPGAAAASSSGADVGSDEAVRPGTGKRAQVAAGTPPPSTSSSSSSAPPPRPRRISLRSGAAVRQLKQGPGSSPSSTTPTSATVSAAGSLPSAGHSGGIGASSSAAAMPAAVVVPLRRLCLLSGGASPLDLREVPSHLFEHFLKDAAALHVLGRHARLGTPMMPKDCYRCVMGALLGAFMNIRCVEESVVGVCVRHPVMPKDCYRWALHCRVGRATAMCCHTSLSFSLLPRCATTRFCQCFTVL